MSLFSRLFGKRTPAVSGPSQPSVDRLASIRPQVDALRVPAIGLFGGPSTGFSQLGGLPSVPAGFDWPLWKSKPLSFVAQIDLSEAHDERLPNSGFLYFFIDQDQETWGMDHEDKGSWRVYYVDAARSDLIEAEAPKGLPKTAIFKRKLVELKSIFVYPCFDDPGVESLDLDDETGDAYSVLNFAAFGGKPSHQLLGVPDPVQNGDMEVECELALRGVKLSYRDARYDPSNAKVLAQAREWKLLLQVDSDDDTGFMWGDGGQIYFWIRESDLAARNFDDVWMVLQCH